VSVIKIMFMSLLPDLMKICDNIVVECDARLVELFQRSFPGVEFLAVNNPDRIELGDRDPDFQIAMGSLGCWLWDQFEQRRKVPYLKADKDLTKNIKKAYGKRDGTHLIGLSWASPLGVFPGLKSLQLNDFAPLFKIKNGLFVDLQYGDTAEERNEFQTLNGASILHDSDIDQLTDINTFSAQVAAMDFVFTVSNSVAHLAGALGVPTAVLLSSAPQWKWSGNRPDSMWYSDVQLVRRDYGESVEKQISQGVNLLVKKLGDIQMLQ